MKDSRESRLKVRYVLLSTNTIKHVTMKDSRESRLKVELRTSKHAQKETRYNEGF